MITFAYICENISLRIPQLLIYCQQILKHNNQLDMYNMAQVKNNGLQGPRNFYWTNLQMEVAKSHLLTRCFGLSIQAQSRPLKATDNECPAFPCSRQSLAPFAQVKNNAREFH